MVSKKKPPKKKKPPSKPAQVRDKPKRGAPSKADKEGVLWMRKLAHIIYTTSEQGISIRQLAEDPRLSGISKTSLERWCAEGKWPEDRQEFFEGIKKRIERQLGNTIVRSRVKQLQDVDSLLLEIRDKFKPLFDEEGKLIIPSPAVSSYEGLVGAYAKLITLSDTLREKISENVVPERFGGVRRDVEITATPKLSKREAREAARAVLQVRRKEIRSEIFPEKEEKEKEPPKLRVLKGKKDA